MAEKKSTQSSGINEVMIDAAEVQLAAFNAGIEFWGQWVKHASKMSASLGKRLQDLKSKPDDTSKILKKVVEENKQQLLAMAELPGHAITQFVEEMKRFDVKKKASGTKGGTKRKPQRSARAKD